MRCMQPDIEDLAYSDDKCAKEQVAEMKSCRAGRNTRNHEDLAITLNQPVVHREMVHHKVNRLGADNSLGGDSLQR